MKHRIVAQLFLTSFFLSMPAWSVTPAVFNYAGQISVKGNAYEGNGFFRFALVNFNCTAASTDMTNCKTFWSNDNSSTLGSQPGSAVELPVSKGTFSVNIGDTAISNMVALDPTTLTHKLYLRIWFDDGANGSEQLEPDQFLTPVIYAVNSKVSENAIGFKQSWADYKNDRTLGTIYQNTTSRPITVKVAISLAGVSLELKLLVGNTSPPTVVIHQSANLGFLNDTSFVTEVSNGTLVVSGIIPPNHFYKISGSTGFNTPVIVGASSPGSNSSGIWASGYRSQIMHWAELR